MRRVVQLAETNDRDVERAVVWAGAVIVVVLLLSLTYALTRPVTVKLSCDVGTWHQLPDGLSWGDDIEMAPDHAHCDIYATGSIASLLRARG